jgi:outer membrane receptor protein involved in Fe transport
LAIEYSCDWLGNYFPPALPPEKSGRASICRVVCRGQRNVNSRLVPWFRQTAVALLFIPFIAAAQSTIRGVIHDPQHRPVQGAQISAPKIPATLSDAQGEFQLPIPADGTYTITATAPGFASAEQTIQVANGKSPIIHIELPLAAVAEAVTVSEAPDRLNAQSATPQTLVAEKEIAQTAGADQSNSLSMITNFTPGAYMVHDMLHMRGGHQVNWLIDGIPVVNTNIAANVAPLINPKDVADLEVERGGYSSEYGDRTYGFFNVVTPSGFDMNNDADLVLSAGNFYSTDDQFRLGGHTRRFAWFGSLDANRSELGLGTPVSQVIHDQASGEGAFVSLIWNATSKDQLRWVASLRGDHYQIPSTNDLELERNYLGGFHWLHTFSDSVTFTLTPYYHYNDAHYVSGPQDTPFILDDNIRSHYVGGQSVLQIHRGKHNARAGLDIWAQHDNVFFGLTANPGGGILQQQELHWANSETLFFEDQYKATKWLTFDLGLRLTHYAGLVNENAADPRLGAAIRIPRLNWVLHGYYAYYYQQPPLDSLAGPSLAFAQQQGFDFIPLKGERDIQHDIGLSIPLHGWSLDVDEFHTSARNFLDHDVIGDSGIFIPLTDLGSIVSGTEVTVRSPRLFRNTTQWRVAYSNQTAQGIGPITGGLLEDAPSGNFLLDHDQRNTLTSVLSLNLPHALWLTPAWQFGSGFLNGDGPAHLPPHSTFDLSIGKRFGERFSVSASAVNIGNARYLLDTSNTFGGTHYIANRQIYGEIRYRFHF